MRLEKCYHSDGETTPEVVFQRYKKGRVLEDES